MRKYLGIACGAALAVAQSLIAPAWAQSDPANRIALATKFVGISIFEEPGGHVIVKPGGVMAAPTGDDLMRVYPAAARKQRVNGRASINCRVDVEGRLTGCRIASEAPLGLGFGAAALSLTPLILMHPATFDGVPVPGYVVRVPFAFTAFPNQTMPAAEIAPPRYGPLGAGVPAPPELSDTLLPRGPLGVLGVTAKGTIMSFLSLDGQVREGDVVEVTLLSIAKSPLPWRGAYLVTRQRIDCANKTTEIQAIRHFDQSGRTIGWTWRDYGDAVPTRVDTEDGQAAAVVCEGQAPTAVISGLDEAVKLAGAWPA